MSCEFSFGWRSFVTEHKLSDWKWAVFQFTNDRFVIVNCYDVPTLPNLLAYGGTSSNIIEISSDSESPTENNAIAVSEDETHISTDIEEDDNLSDEDECDENQDYFICTVRNNTAVCSLDFNSPCSHHLC